VHGLQRESVLNTSCFPYDDERKREALVRPRYLILEDRFPHPLFLLHTYLLGLLPITNGRSGCALAAPSASTPSALRITRLCDDSLQTLSSLADDFSDEGPVQVIYLEMTLPATSITIYFTCLLSCFASSLIILTLV